MKFTFIIQFKYDSVDRLTNLLRSLIYLTYQFKDEAEYLVILQNNTPIEEVNCVQYLTKLFHEYELSNIRIFSCDLPDPYYRSKIINEGLKIASNDICVIYDCDILLPKEQIELGVELCQDKFPLVFPYTNPEYHIERDYFKEFETDYDFYNLQFKIAPKMMLHRHIEDGYPPIAYATGFCMIVNKRLLGDLVYFNEEFNGWGYEDSEYILKMNLFNIKMTRVYGPVFHVQHERVLQNKYKEYTDRNQRLYVKLKNENIETLKNYYKTPKII